VTACAHTLIIIIIRPGGTCRVSQKGWHPDDYNIYIVAFFAFKYFDSNYGINY
jgi:hypothetical protein